MRTDHNEWKIKVLFIKDKIVAQEKEEYIKNSIHTPASSITESCSVEKPPKEGIKIIKKYFDACLQVSLFKSANYGYQIL